jgi:hypothetical protein
MPGKSPKPKKPAEEELRPHKIIGQLIGARFNEHGEIVAEEVMGEVAIFKANFSKLPAIVDAAVAAAREEEEMVRRAQGGEG